MSCWSAFLIFALSLSSLLIVCCLFLRRLLFVDSPTVFLAGTYNTQSLSVNASYCVSCVRGAYCQQAAATPTSCPVATYNRNTGGQSLTACALCPTHSWSPLSSVSSSACACVAGYFGSNGTICTPCATGLSLSLCLSLCLSLSRCVSFLAVIRFLCAQELSNHPMAQLRVSIALPILFHLSQARHRISARVCRDGREQTAQHAARALQVCLSLSLFVFSVCVRVSVPPSFFLCELLCLQQPTKLQLALPLAPLVLSVPGPLLQVLLCLSASVDRATLAKTPRVLRVCPQLSSLLSVLPTVRLARSLLGLRLQAQTFTSAPANLAILAAMARLVRLV